MSAPEIIVRASSIPAVPRRPGVGASGVAYDGSSRVDQIATWSPALRSADADLLPEKGLLDARARDTARNDAYVAGGAQVHRDNIVGSQYRLIAKPRSKVLFGRQDEAWERAFAEEVETLFALWAEGPECWADASRMDGLTGLVRLGITSQMTQGEVLGTAEWMRDDGRPFRSALQLVDPDRLSTPATMLHDRSIRGGVEQDRRGAPVAYHVRETHPSDVTRLGSPGDAFRWRRIPRAKPWGRQMVLHLYERQRVGQSRGVSAMVAALMELRMTKHFRKTQLQAAVLSASYAASIESDMPSQVPEMLGAGEADENPHVAWMRDYLSAVTEYTGSANNLHIDGVKVPVFAPGTKLRIQHPGGTPPLGAAFEASLLRHIAASLGVSYEQLSRDYTQTNYSSARAALGETMKFMLGRKFLIADPLANFVYRLWLEEAVNYSLLDTLRRRRGVPSFYDGLNASAFANAEWIGAGQGQIDPLKETQAEVLRLRAGLTTKERAIARLHGADWREVAQQIARERALDEALGNPSVYEREATDQENALSGTPQEREA